MTIRAKTIGLITLDPTTGVFSLNIGETFIAAGRSAKALAAIAREHLVDEICYSYDCRLGDA